VAVYYRSEPGKYTRGYILENQTAPIRSRISFSSFKTYPVCRRDSIVSFVRKLIMSNSFDERDSRDRNPVGGILKQPLL
jgi:hypothetical protein